MRIDYSEPKKSYVSARPSNRPRKEPVSLLTTLIIATGIIAFIGGFGTGWFFSQRAAKKSFQAATMQNSLESAPNREVPQPKTQQPPVQANAIPQNSSTQANPAAQAAQETPLSFYKTLPSGQRLNAIGSGINPGDDKAKQPLQAAIPSNLIKPPPPAPDTRPDTEKNPAADKTPAKPREVAGFTVQMASYTLKSEAEAVKGKLAGKGYHAFISESNQGDKGIWYRVRVGRKMEQEAAKELAARLGKGAMVIPDRE